MSAVQAAGIFGQLPVRQSVVLAFAYGQTKGYRAAADKTPRRKRSGPKSRATASAERVSG